MLREQRTASLERAAARSCVARDQARLRLDVLRGRQGLPPRHALPAGGGEDGGDPAARGRRARTATASTPTSRASRARTTSIPTPPLHAPRTASRRSRSGLGRDGGRRRPLPALLPALPAAPAPVLLGRGRARRTRSATFWALDLARERRRRGRHARDDASRSTSAEEDGTLAALGVHLLARERRDLRRHRRAPGARLVSFAPILKHGVFPLAEHPRRPARRSAPAGMGGAGRDRVRGQPGARAGEPREFGFLQLRPLALARGDRGARDRRASRRPTLLCRSPRVLGQRADRRHPRRGGGRLPPLRPRASSREAAREIGALQRRSCWPSGVPYLLIGVGPLGLGRSRGSASR